MDTMKSAIILDGHIKSALIAVRSLGAAGIEVSVGSTRKTAMSMHSKYARHQFIYPSPYADEKAFVEAVELEAVRLGGKPVVYAFSDATLLALYRNRAVLDEVVTISWPSPQSMEIAFDKAATYSLARVSGVPTIHTYTPTTHDELSRVAESLTYPAVVKTRRSVTWRDGKGIFGTASFVLDAKSLHACFLDIEDRVGEAPLIQDFIHGEEYGVEMLTHEGEAYALLVHHRIHSLSPTGGASVLKETLLEGDLRQMLIEYATVLAKKLSWTGPIMVEFKVDADTREPYLMEINGRFWGSLPLAVHSGVDVPLLYFKAQEGEFPSRCIEGREGVRSTHFLGDVLHLMRVLFVRDRMRKFVYPKRIQTLRNFFMPSHAYQDVWSLSDLKPGFMEMVDMIQSRLSK